MLWPVDKDKQREMFGVYIWVVRVCGESSTDIIIDVGGMEIGFMNVVCVYASGGGVVKSSGLDIFCEMSRVRHHINPYSVRTELSFAGFDVVRPLVVDIGAARGGFVRALADVLPACNFIACEIRPLMLQKIMALCGDCDRIVAFGGDARRNFRSLLEPSLTAGAELRQVFVNFPDPWFKEKHKKRRFITPEFLCGIAEWFPVEAEFVFQTDQEFLYRETQEYLAETPFAVRREFDESPHGVMTEWERDKVARGEQIYRMAFGL